MDKIRAKFWCDVYLCSTGIGAFHGADEALKAFDERFGEEIRKCPTCDAVMGSDETFYENDNCCYRCANIETIVARRKKKKNLIVSEKHIQKLYL